MPYLAFLLSSQLCNTLQKTFSTLRASHIFYYLFYDVVHLHYTSTKNYFGLRYEVPSKFIIFLADYTTILIELMIIFHKFICLSLCFQLFRIYTQPVELLNHIGF